MHSEAGTADRYRHGDKNRTWQRCLHALLGEGAYKLDEFASGGQTVLWRYQVEIQSISLRKKGES